MVVLDINTFFILFFEYTLSYNHVNKIQSLHLLVYSGVGRCQKVCVGGGVGVGAHIHIIYVPSVKNQYKRVVFGYMVIY